ncbi:hypothetical protein Tco_1165353 [Tanacetum coccineum]
MTKKTPNSFDSGGVELRHKLVSSHLCNIFSRRERQFSKEFPKTEKSSMKTSIVFSTMSDKKCGLFLESRGSMEFGNTRRIHQGYNSTRFQANLTRAFDPLNGIGKWVLYGVASFNLLVVNAIPAPVNAYSRWVRFDFFLGSREQKSPCFGNMEFGVFIVHNASSTIGFNFGLGDLIRRLACTTVVLGRRGASVLVGGIVPFVTSGITIIGS